MSTESIAESIGRCSTPRALRELTKEAMKVSSKLTPQDLEDIYRAALAKVDDFHGVLDRCSGLQDDCKFPKSPSYGENINVNLNGVIQWCRDAEKIVDALPQKMDKAVLDDLIKAFDDLDKLVAERLPQVDKEKWKKATERANKSGQMKLHLAMEDAPVELLLELSKKEASGKPLSESEIIERCEREKKVSSDSIANLGVSDEVRCQIELDNRYFREPQRLKIVEGFYRDLDKDYVKSWQRFESDIEAAFVRIESHFDQQPTGDLLEAYCKLSGLPLHKRFDECYQALGVAFLVESEILLPMLGRRGDQVQSVINGVVDILSQVLQAILEKETLYDLVPPLGVFKPVPFKDVSHLLTLAQITARFAQDNEVPEEVIAKIKTLYVAMCTPCLNTTGKLLYSTDPFKADDRKYWMRRWSLLADEIKETLFDALDQRKYPKDDFGALTHKYVQIMQGMGIEGDFYQYMKIDPQTRILLPEFDHAEKPANQQEGENQNGPDKKVSVKSVSVDLKQYKVSVDGESFQVSERQAKFIDALNLKPNEWIPGGELRDHTNERLDKLKKDLPSQILNLIRSHKRNGYMLITKPESE